jgi:hypothetical protein
MDEGGWNNKNMNVWVRDEGGWNYMNMKGVGERRVRMEQ